MGRHEAIVCRGRIERHDALGRLIALVGTNLNGGFAIIGLLSVHVLRIVARHVRIAVSCATILLTLGHAIGTRHVALSEILRRRRSAVFYRGLGACGVIQDLRGTNGLFYEVTRGHKKPLTRVINVKRVRLILTNFTQIRRIRTGSHIMCTRHNGLIKGNFRFGEHAKVVGILRTHDFVDFQLLETALSRDTIALSDTGSHLCRLKGSLSVSHDRCLRLNARLKEFRIVLHSIGVSIGGTGTLKHVFHLFLPHLSGSIASIHVQHAGIGLRGHILLNASAKEGLHVAMFVFGRGDALTREGTDHVVTVHVLRGCFGAIRAEFYHGNVGIHGNGGGPCARDPTRRIGWLIGSVAKRCSVGAIARFGRVGVSIGRLIHHI